MRWFITLMLALVMVTPTFAGEDPYVATVTYLGTANPLSDFNGTVRWYVSPKHQQFLLDEVGFLGGNDPATQFAAMCAPISGTTAQCEKFTPSEAKNQPEICDGQGIWNGPFNFSDRGLLNAVVRAGNLGKFEWWVRLPKKPSGEINLVLQCGVLKPGGFSFQDNFYSAIEKCAAEAGERTDSNCTRIEVDPGTNPLITRALPTITAMAYPGLYNYGFKPFNLTAFRNPGPYAPFSGANMVNGSAAQLLDAVKYPDDTKIVLKACMDKAIITKLPVTGQVNATGDVETDLEYGDMIYVRLDIPRFNSVDIYCNQQSLKVVGVGETWY
jgi:hypothetical protein